MISFLLSLFDRPTRRRLALGFFFLAVGLLAWLVYQGDAAPATPDKVTIGPDGVPVYHFTVTASRQ